MRHFKVGRAATPWDTHTHCCACRATHMHAYFIERTCTSCRFGSHGELKMRGKPFFSQPREGQRQTQELPRCRRQHQQLRCCRVSIESMPGTRVATDRVPKTPAFLLFLSVGCALGACKNAYKIVSSTEQFASGIVAKPWLHIDSALGCLKAKLTRSIVDAASFGTKEPTARFGSPRVWIGRRW